MHFVRYIWLGKSLNATREKMVGFKFKYLFLRKNMHIHFFIEDYIF
jgi:hypothetical protein